MFIDRISTAVFFVVVGLGSACASHSYDPVPPGLESLVDQNVSFVQLKDSADAYRGRVVLFGGEVLSAKRLKDATRIEILQLPLEGAGDPVRDRTASEGRFLAFQKEFLDPAKLPAGTRVTVVGEVTGVMTQPLDESEYTYPTLEVKNLTVWPRGEERYRPYYPNYGYGPYWGPYRGWGSRWGRYPYWW